MALRTSYMLLNERPRSSTTRAIVRATRSGVVPGRPEDSRRHRSRRRIRGLGGATRGRCGARSRKRLRLILRPDVDRLLECLMLAGDCDVEVVTRQVRDGCPVTVGHDRIDGDEVR